MRAVIAAVSLVVALAGCQSSEEEPMKDWAPDTDIFLSSAIETPEGIELSEPTNITD